VPTINPRNHTIKCLILCLVIEDIPKSAAFTTHMTMPALLQCQFDITMLSYRIIMQHPEEDLQGLDFIRIPNQARIDITFVLDKDDADLRRTMAEGFNAIRSQWTQHTEIYGWTEWTSEHGQILSRKELCT
jgi:hypothetical protein